MPRRRGDGPGHTRACRRAQEAAVRGLVADAVAEAHEAHAAARCDLEGSARAFLNETALPAVRGPERSGGPYAAPGNAPDRERRPARGSSARRRPSTGTGWSGASPIGRAGPCPWGTPCG